MIILAFTDVHTSGYVDYTKKAYAEIKKKAKKADLILCLGDISFFGQGLEEAGVREIVVRARNTDVSRSTTVELSLLDEPKVKIDQLSYPKEVRYNEYYKVVFVIEKESFSNPQDTTVKLVRNEYGKEWSIGEVKGIENFVIDLQAKDLNPGTNSFEVIVNYYDSNGKQHSDESSFSIELVDVNIWQRIMIKFNQLGKKIGEWIG